MPDHCTGDIQSIDLLNNFPSLKHLTFCAHASGGFPGRSADDYGHKVPVAFFHAYSILKAGVGESPFNSGTIESIEIKVDKITTMVGRDSDSAFQAGYHKSRLQNLLKDHPNLPSEERVVIIDEDGRRSPLGLIIR